MSIEIEYTEQSVKLDNIIQILNTVNRLSQATRWPDEWQVKEVVARVNGLEDTLKTLIEEHQLQDDLSHAIMDSNISYLALEEEEELQLKLQRLSEGAKHEINCRLKPYFDQLFKTPLQSIFAYYLAKQFEVASPSIETTASSPSQEHYQNILSLINIHPSYDVKSMLQAFQQYAEERGYVLSTTELREATNAMRLLQRAHHHVKKLHSRDLHERILVHERYARDILGDLAERFGSNLSLCEAQNEVVSVGIRFHEDNPLLYSHGALVTIQDILSIDRRRLAAWLLSDRLANFYEYGEGQERLLHQDFHYLHTLGKIDDVDVLCDAYKKALKTSSQWTTLDDEQVDAWIADLKKILELYDHLSEQMFKGPGPEKARVLLIGDSISAGWGISDPEKRWVHLMAEAIKANDLPFEIANCSIPGAQTDQGAQSIEAMLKAFKPDIVLGTQAGNDAHVGKSIYKIEANIVKIINTCLEYMKEEFPESDPHKRVKWGTGIPATFKNAGPMGRASFADMLEKISRDTGIETLRLSDELLSKKNIQADRIHFVEAIQPDVAEVAFQTVAPMVKMVMKGKNTDQSVEGECHCGPQVPLIFMKNIADIKAAVLAERAKHCPQQDNDGNAVEESPVDVAAAPAPAA